MYDKKRAVTYMIMATLFFALMSFFVKLATDVPSIEKAMYRNLVGVIVMFAVIGRQIIIRSKTDGFRESLTFLKPKAPKALLGRVVFGTAGVILNYYAIDNLILADSTILGRLAPFFTVLGASLFLGEKLSKKIIISMFVSFFGILLVVKPAFNLDLVPYLAGVGAAFLAGFAYMFIRILGSKGEDSNIIVFYFSLFSVITMIPLALPVYKSLNPKEVVYVFLASFSAMFAQSFITRAYKYAPANEVSVYLNVQVVFTAILGFMFFNEIPDLLSVLGYCVIIYSSYWAFKK